MRALRVEPALAAVAACATAVRNPDHWSEVARRTARALRADRGTIGFLTVNRDFLLRACPETDPAWHARYSAEMHAHNEVWSEASRLRPGQVHTTCSEGAGSRYRSSIIYNEFIRPQGLDALLTLCLTDSRRGCVGLLTLGRRHGRSSFDGSDAAAARMLAGTLAATLRGQAFPIGSVRAQRSCPRELLVTPAGRLLREEAWLEPWIRCGVFRVMGGMLSSPHLPALAAAIGATGRTPEGWPPPVGITAGPLDTPLGSIRLELSPGGPSARGAVRIRIYVEPDETAEDALIRRFGLTRRECDVARLLASGMTLPEVAETLEIGLTTARTHLTRLFDKTDTHTQLRLALLLQRAMSGSF